MKIITVEHLSKYYTIGHDRNSGAIRYKTFRESMMSAGRSLYQRLRHPLSPNREQVELEEFRALDDVSFEVEQGDRIGIIGRNGAGKSTLLKLLCRITEPTKGRITMRGRVASLLEVGTGFHPELSGRENIYLNGAILGMKRAEIKRKFDEIVDFSGVEKFLDTPVKRYSSGMYVRLAFAVAAHLESEILLIDEVLAVGDAEFQKKCLGKMDDISKTEGRTILFVSHNMGAIKNLCNKGILFIQGQLDCFGQIDYTLKKYENLQYATFLAPKHLPQTKSICITNFTLLDENKDVVNQLYIGKSYFFKLSFKNTSQIPIKGNFDIAIGINSSMGIKLANLNLSQVGATFSYLDILDEKHIYFKIYKFPLLPDRISLNLWIAVNGVCEDYITAAASYPIFNHNFYSDCIPTSLPSEDGILLLDYQVIQNIERNQK